MNFMTGKESNMMRTINITESSHRQDGECFLQRFSSKSPSDQILLVEAETCIDMFFAYIEKDLYSGQPINIKRQYPLSSGLITVKLQRNQPPTGFFQRLFS